MKLPLGLRLPIAALCALFMLYPNPVTLVRSVAHVVDPQVDPAAVAGLAASMPDNPRLIEREVLERAVPYEYDWQVDGVPWYFPTTAEAVAARRGDCESRALVLASILEAKGIPYRLRMSFDHIWVDYPGKRASALENDGVVLVERRGGRFVWRWPRDLHPYQELQAQLSMYWSPMPTVRKVLLIAGPALVLVLNLLWAAAARLRGRRRACALPAAGRASGRAGVG